jgi:autotransporter translocation and assembly factor TamB
MPRLPTLRRVAKWGLGLALLVLGLAAAGLLVLQTEWAHDWVKRRIVAAIALNLDATLTIDALEGSLLGTPSLRGVKLVDRAGHEVARIDRVTADVALWPLLTSGSLHVRTLVVDAPVVALTQQPDGAWNLAHLLAARPPAAPRPPGAAPAVVIDELRVQHGSVAVTPLGQPVATLAEIGLHGHVGASETVVDALRGRWQENGKDLVAGATLTLGRAGAPPSLDAHVTLGASQVQITRLVLGGYGALAGTLHAQVAAADWASLVPTLPAAAAGAVAAIDVELTRDPALHARVSGTLRGLRDLGDFRLSGEATQAGERWSGRLQADSARPTITAVLAGGALVADGALRFDAVTLHASSPGYQPASGKWAIGAGTLDGHVTGAFPTLTFEGDLALADVAAGKTRLGAIAGHLRVWDNGRAADATLHAGDAKKDLEVDAHVTVNDDGVATTLRVVEARARVRRLHLDASGGEVVAQHAGPITVRKVHFTSPAGTIDLNGELNGPNGAKELRLELNDVDLARLRTGLVLPGLPAQGRMSGTLIIARATDVPSMTFGADVQHVVLTPKARPMTGRFEGKIANGRANLKVRFTGTGLALDVSLSASVPSLDRLSAENIDQARISGHGIDLARLWVTMGVKSDLLGRVTTLDVKLDGRTGSVKAHVEGLRPRQSSFALTGDVEGTLKGGVLRLHAHGGDADFGRFDATAEATAPRMLFDARGWRRALPEALRAAHASATGLDLEAAQALLGLPLRAVGRADVELAVTAGAHGARLDLALHRAGAFGTDLRLDATLHADTSGGQLAAQGQVQLPFARVDVALGAHVPADLTDASAWRGVDDRALTSLTASTADVALAPFFPARWHVRRGVGDAKLTLAAPGAPLVLEAHLAGVQVGTLHRQLAVHLHAELDENGTRAQVDSRFGTEPLVHGDATVAAGRAALRQGHPDAFLAAVAQGRLQVDAFPVAVLTDEAELPVPVAAALEGHVRAEATLAGSLATPQLDATVAFEGARIGASGFAQLGAKGRLRDGHLSASLQATQREGGTLEVRFVDRGKTGEGEARLKASGFRLVALAPLVRAASGSDWLIEADGTLSGSLSATGSATAPTIEGLLTLRDGTLRLRDVLPRLTHLQLRVTPDGSALRFVASAESEGGNLGVDGDAELDEWIPKTAHAHVQTTKLRVDVAGLSGLASVNAQVLVDHDREHRKWVISANLDDSELTLLGGNSGYGENEDIVEPKGAGKAPESLLLTISTLGGATVHVIDDLGDLGKLDAYATLQISVGHEPGETSTRLDVSVADDGRSNYTFLDVPYEISGATLGLHAGDTSPSIDARAFKTYRSLVLRALVTGTLANLRVTLSSEPGGFTQEQLLQFALGQNPDLMDSGSRSSLRTSVAGAAANVTLKKLFPKLGSLVVIGLDEVGDASAPVTRYSLGHWFSENVFVTVRHRTTIDVTQNSNELFLQWRLPFRGVMFEVAAGDGGETGTASADLVKIWRW